MQVWTLCWLIHLKMNFSKTHIIIGYIRLGYQCIHIRSQSERQALSVGYTTICESNTPKARANLPTSCLFPIQHPSNMPRESCYAHKSPCPCSTPRWRFGLLPLTCPSLGHCSHLESEWTNSWKISQSLCHSAFQINKQTINKLFKKTNIGSNWWNCHFLDHIRGNNTVKNINANTMLMVWLIVMRKLRSALRAKNLDGNTIVYL